MNTEMFASLLLTISLLTSLMTEAIKKACPEISCNVTAGLVTTAVTVFSCLYFVAANHPTVDFQFIMTCIALWVMSWLSAMLGYDKVIQTLKQIGAK